jgi:SAM-dependent methyltransferase
VDPLETSYRANATLVAMRNPAVEYREGSVEALPAESGRYDLAIIENCIDHVRDVHGGMRELKRVLRPGGTLYLTVNCRTSWGFVAHRALSRLRIDAGHPHTFTPRRAQRLVKQHGFEPLQIEVGSYSDARREDVTATERRTRMKGLLGISEFIVSVIAQATSNG